MDIYIIFFYILSLRFNNDSKTFRPHKRTWGKVLLILAHRTSGVLCPVDEFSRDSNNARWKILISKMALCFILKPHLLFKMCHRGFINMVLGLSAIFLHLLPGTKLWNVWSFDEFLLLLN